MVEEKVYQVVVASPAKIRYQENILPYIFENFSLERAIEIDGNILQTAGTLSKKPGRGRKEKYLKEAREEFKFILHKETKHFEIKIIYYINESEQTVNIIDFFPTKMDPQKISKNK
jgi:plasmid stabilization system protein ParE